MDVFFAAFLVKCSFLSSLVPAQRALQTLFSDVLGLAA